MLTSIKKITKSFLGMLLIGVIVLSFVFLGMGDVFRAGNQNIVVTIDSEKISAQNFVEYVNRLNLKKEQRDSLQETDLLDQILSEYIGKKIIELEIIEQGINLNNQSLKEIITTDEFFRKDNKFSRTQYEKFLLESGISSTVFEQNTCFHGGAANCLLTVKARFLPSTRCLFTGRAMLHTNDLS